MLISDWSSDVCSSGLGGPAEKAGIEPGDVILSFDGKRVDRMRRLPRIVAESRIGEDVPTEIWRKGERITLQVAVGELNETEGAETAAVSENGDKADETKVPGLGMSLSAMTDDLRHRPEDRKIGV